MKSKLAKINRKNTNNEEMLGNAELELLLLLCSQLSRRTLTVQEYMTDFITSAAKLSLCLQT